MRFHRNAKLGLAGRRELVLAIAGGSSIREAARIFDVSTATAHRWWRRWRQASEAERASLSCLLDRSSRPHRSPRRLAPKLERAICECRRKTGRGPRLVAGATGFAHSTVWKVLRRFGLSRPPRPPREPANRYEWPCPGDRLHMDVSRYARFRRPGHRVTGNRSRTTSEVHRRVGYDHVHAIVDDHSRLAYAEIDRDERAQTVVGFLERALAVFADHGIQPKRLMTDNAFAYIHSRAVREPLAQHKIRHLLTRPHRPRTNGKVERFHQTMASEWAHGLVYRSDRERRRTGSTTTDESQVGGRSAAPLQECGWVRVTAS
jgi:transposase